MGVSAPAGEKVGTRGSVSYSKGSSRKVSLGALVLAFLFLLAAIPVGAATALLFSYEQGGAIYPGVRAGAVDLGRLTPSVAAAQLQAALPEPREFVLYIAGEPWRIPLSELGVELDAGTTIHWAQQVGRRGPLWQRVADVGQAMVYGHRVPLAWRVDRQQLRKRLEALAASLGGEPRNARLVSEGDRVRVEPHRSRVVLRAETLEQDVLAALQRGATQIAVRADVQRPGITEELLHAWGVDALLSSFTTRYDPTDIDRSHNIWLAAQALDGAVIPPGHVFSFNEVVGPRRSERGYRPAPVILNGRFVEDIGGGVCQVSSTLYNAALLAGADIVARVPHSLPVSYVPLGRDATVAEDSVDFRFRNPFPHPLVLQARAHDGELTIEIFGSASDRRRYRLITVVETLHREVREVADAALAPGQREVRDEGREGYRVKLFRVREDAQGPAGRDGAESELIAVSRYAPSPRLIAVGTGSAVARGEV